MQMYLVHNSTATNNGSVIAITSDILTAKKALADSWGYKVSELENVTDWGHFIRVVELDKPFYLPTSLPRAEIVYG